MCNPAPAPRCSAHAITALHKAQKSGDKNAIRTAEADYALTHKFTSELREQAHNAYDTELARIQTLPQEEQEEAMKKNARKLARSLKYATRQDAERNRLNKQAAQIQARVKIAKNPNTPLPTVSLLAETDTEPLKARLAAIKNLQTRNGFFATFTADNVAGMFGIDLNDGVTR